MCFSDQWTFKAVGKHSFHSVHEKWEGQTNLPWLYTKSLSGFSAHHFSDSDNSTKSIQYPCRGTGCEVSELTSHIKNTRDQLGNENDWIYTQMRGVWEELGPKSAAELCVNSALCLSMVLLPNLFYCQPFTQWALKQLNQRFNLAQNHSWRTYWMDIELSISYLSQMKNYIYGWVLCNPFIVL